MQSQAISVATYLKELPSDRRTAIETLRQVILANLDQGFEETIAYGMIGYVVPHRVYPPGYHCDPSLPLPYISLASQKNYMSLYMMAIYEACDDARDESPQMAWFRQAWAATGKKLNMGKCCIRFRHADDLALDVIAQAIRNLPLAAFLEHYEHVRGQTKRAKEKSGTTSAQRQKPPPKTTAKKLAKKTSAKKLSKRQA